MKVSEFMKPSEGCWFDFKDDLKIKIKPLTKALSRRISRLCTEKKYKKGGYHDVVDDDKMDKLLSKELVVDWKNFQDNSGKDIPCTPDNVTALLDNWQELSVFVNEVAIGYQESLDKQKEKLAKN